MPSISKKTRFDVFKRDGFNCQYCGRTPPTVILEVDHINPKSNNGKDDINNYITACFDCNRGKGKTTLDIIPDGIATNLERLKERQKQFKSYSRYLLKQEEKLITSCYNIDGTFFTLFPNHKLSETFIDTTIKTFVSKLPEAKVKDALKLACSRINDPERALQYFCGICWNWIKNPECRDW